MEFPALMEIENDFSTEKLFRSSDELTLEELQILRDKVIGSNRKKTEICENLDIIPKLLEILKNNNPLELQLSAAIIIGSLSKGTESNLESLVNCGVLDCMVNLVLSPTSNVQNTQLIEIYLGVIKNLVSSHNHPFYSNIDNLTKIVQLATPQTSVNFQSHVVNILLSICNNYNAMTSSMSSSLILCQAGGIIFLARLIQTDYMELQLPGLKCLASMCFTNRAVSDIVCGSMYKDKKIVDILTSLTSRTKHAQVQLSAARTLTYIHRSGSLKSTDSKIVFKTLPTLARLCSVDYDEDIRAAAAESLAYLAEIDAELQRLAAISSQLILSLTNLLTANGQGNASNEAKIGAFRCFGSLASNDENIRKRIIEMRGLIEEVLSGLKDESYDVRLSAVRCLHSLSRSVQLLRTTFQDHSVWRPLMALMNENKSTTSELLTVITSTVCNLLLEFSPAKEKLLEAGTIDVLCKLTKSEDAALRLNGSWALMNMAFQAEQHVKTKIINCLSTENIIQLLNDSDTRVIMKTLGLLRNLLSSSVHIDAIMETHSQKIMSALLMVLESNNSSELKEQCLCIVGNIGANPSKDYVLEDDRILSKLKEYLDGDDHKLKNGAFFVVKNLVSKGKQMKLENLGIIERYDKIMENANEIDVPFDDETFLDGD